MSTPDTRCTDCYNEFSQSDLPEGTKCCPKCSSASVPCDPKDDVTLKLNWHELRILGIFASNWAGDKCKGTPTVRTVNAILSRLEKQYPEMPKLTLFGEIRELSEKLGTKVEMVHNGTTTTFDPPKA
jgi:hypothetical protein